MRKIEDSAREKGRESEHKRVCEGGRESERGDRPKEGEEGKEI